MSKKNDYMEGFEAGRAFQSSLDENRIERLINIVEFLLEISETTIKAKQDYDEACNKLFVSLGEFIQNKKYE